MAKRTSTSASDDTPALLTVPREKLRADLLKRIELGKELPNSFSNYETLSKAETEYSKWNSYNYELLRRSFTKDEYARSYSGYVFGGFSINKQVSLSQNMTNFNSHIQQKIETLDRLENKLNLIGEADSVKSNTLKAPTASTMPGILNNNIFIVHGRDNEARGSSVEIHSTLTRFGSCKL